MNNEYTENDLDILYLMSKKTDNLEYLYNTKFEECYMLENNVYLFKSRYKDITDFKIYNLNYIKKCNEPIVEIKVIPKDASITISSFYIDRKTKLIKAKYDEIDKNWDVRSYIEGEEKLTEFNKDLIDLSSLDLFGLEIKEKITSIIDLSRKVFEKAKEKKRYK